MVHGEQEGTTMREDTALLLCEDFFKNRKDVLLSVRLPRELVETLESLAVENDQPFADYIRSCLCFFGLPSLLKEMASEGPLDEEDKSILQTVKDYCQTILDSCEGVGLIRERVLEVRALGEETESLVSRKVTEKLNRAVTEMKCELDRKEAERQAKGKARKLAGIEGPEHQEIRLNESELEGLTPSQRRQRQLLGLE
jgi:hypothetical protein